MATHDNERFGRRSYEEERYRRGAERGGDYDFERGRSSREEKVAQVLDRYVREGSYGGGSQMAYGGRWGRSSEFDWKGSGGPGYENFASVGYSPSSGYGPGAFYTEGTEDADQGSRGRETFVGYGPKNYQRSDESILEDVCVRLTRHGHIDASNIQVNVSRGEVTLQGTVADRQTKRRAEDVAESVSGVHDVHNQLRVVASAEAS